MKPWLAKSMAEEPGSTLVQVGVGVGVWVGLLVGVGVPAPLLVPHPATSNPRLVRRRTDNRRVTHALVIVVISHRRLSIDSRATQIILDLVATEHPCDIATSQHRGAVTFWPVFATAGSHLTVVIAPGRGQGCGGARGSSTWWEAQPGNAIMCGILEDVRAAT